MIIKETVERTQELQLKDLNSTCPENWFITIKNFQENGTDIRLEIRGVVTLILSPSEAEQLQSMLQKAIKDVQS